jgi:hypothetical protein
MKYGDTRSGPRSAKVRCCSVIPIRPPIALPNSTPTRAGSYAPSSPACSAASVAAATPSTTKRSSRRASFGPTTSAGSNPRTSAAIRTGNPVVSKLLMKSIPLRPATAASQVERRSLPSGVTAPRPVTATLRIA